VNIRKNGLTGAGASEISLQSLQILRDVRYSRRKKSAVNRHTRQTAGAAFGDRGDKTCLKLRQSLPPDYRKQAVIHTDFRESDADIPPSERHRAGGKESGQTAHIERFGNTLRRRCPAAERKTLSFSKDEAMHGKRIRIFIDFYNKSLSV
jgi:IS1 family transposase